MPDISIFWWTPLGLVCVLFLFDFFVSGPEHIFFEFCFGALPPLFLTMGLFVFSFQWHSAFGGCDIFYCFRILALLFVINRTSGFPVGANVYKNTHLYAIQRLLHKENGRHCKIYLGFHYPNNCANCHNNVHVEIVYPKRSKPHKISIKSSRMLLRKSTKPPHWWKHERSPK